MQQEIEKNKKIPKSQFSDQQYTMNIPQNQESIQINKLSNKNKKRSKKPSGGYSIPQSSLQQKPQGVMKQNTRKQIIKNFIEEGKRLGQIFKQTELEYKTFLVEGQKIKGFDRHQFAYWNGYLMSMQNLYSIFEFEGKLREFEVYIKELRDWEAVFLKMLEEQQQSVVQNKNHLSVNRNNNQYSQYRKNNQNYKYIKYQHNEAELSMIMEQSSRNEIDQSQNFELIRKSVENSKDITMIKIMENYTEEDLEEDYNTNGVSLSNAVNQNTDTAALQSWSEEENIMSNSNENRNLQNSVNAKGQKGLQLPQSQKIQLHPNLKNANNNNLTLSQQNSYERSNGQERPKLMTKNKNYNNNDNEKKDGVCTIF